ncbi:7-keto-8-aminopelargonate synthetase-like enzyme [Bradyrhizobium sp. GM7.3]
MNNERNTWKGTDYVAALRALKEDYRFRGLKPRAGTDFTSNDYLGLASAPA